MLFRSVGLFLGLREGGQQHAGKDCDDGDDDQELDQRERGCDRCSETLADQRTGLASGNAGVSPGKGLRGV